MRVLLTALSLTLVPACGGAPPLPPEQAQARCAALLPQLGGEFGCRTDELTAGLHTQLEAEHVFEVDVRFRASGTVERFTGLRRVGRGGDVPECVVGRLRALRLPPGEATTVPLRVRYLPETPQGAYAAALTSGGCALTLAPSP